jgi:asparagine synthase (glutamine-hydrolysing)
MCGIAGLMTRDGTAPNQAKVEAMGVALAHRGPDGIGRYGAGDVSMIHRRLAVIDLENGDQPLYEPGGAALIANAEVYNYVELREEFGAAAFSTHSDCEPPLQVYRRHGVRFADYLRGMYAIALHDPAENRLLLSRDPFGIKPLYYAETPAGFAFASEPQALIAAGLIEPRVDAARRYELLQLQFSTGAPTIYAGIHRLLPGETLVVTGGRIVERTRRAALPDVAPNGAAADETAALKVLDTALRDSILVHQRSDVPYGMFLSGGVDSSVLLALMAEVNETPVRAFTAGFAGGVHDERDHARALCAEVGAEFIGVEVTEGDFWSLLPEIAAAMDDPAADYAIVPTYKLAREASRDLKVILCGEGGDELFAGYGRHRGALRPWWLGGRTPRSHGIFDGLNVLRETDAGWRDGILAAESTANRDGRSRLQVVQAIDCADWLPHDLLIKIDRCLMAHGVEGRTPLLDPAVAAASYPLADDLKVRNGQGKYLLRRWLADRLPSAKPFSRKRGFTVPIIEWIGRHGARIGDLVAAQPGVLEVADAERVRALYLAKGKREGLAAWVLLFYALWHRRHVLGQVPDGDVFDVLSQAA